jgi:hypothetical protein
MNTKKDNLISIIESLLDNHHSNCGSNRGRDGEYLSDDVSTIVGLFKQLKEIVVGGKGNESI